jgi:hypothetical protein
LLSVGDQIKTGSDTLSWDLNHHQSDPNLLDDWDWLEQSDLRHVGTWYFYFSTQSNQLSIPDQGA